MSSAPEKKLPFALRPPEFTLLNDAPLHKDRTGEESFGLPSKLTAVYDAIRHPQMQSPFTVMISGGWGTGKSSSMVWLHEQFRLWNDGKPDDGVHIDATWFYPWKYQDKEDVWRGLIATVILATIDFENVDMAKVVTAAKQFGSFLGGSFLRVLGGLEAKAKVGGADVSFKGQALQGILEEWGKHITPHRAYFNDFEHAFEHWVKANYDDSGADHKERKRLVVFIDDLDRCMPDIALQVLEALKLYLNVQSLVFVIGVDKKVIDGIVARRYCEMLGEEAMKHEPDGEESFARKAAQYLDKMFQIEVDVTPNHEQVRTFVTNQLKGTAWSDLEEGHRRIFQDLIEREASNNPRAVVRHVNTMLQGAAAAGRMGDFTRAQCLQQMFLPALFRRLQPHNTPFTEEGRRFLADWSRTLREHPDGPSHIKSSLLSVAENQEQAIAMNLPLRGTEHASFGMPQDDRERFAHLLTLAENYPTHRHLLSDPSLGMLLRIPYEVKAAELVAERADVSEWTEKQWLRLQSLVASATGLDLASVTPESVRELQELDLSGTDLVDQDLPLLSGLTALSSLSIFGTPVTDLKPISGLIALTDLSLSDTLVADALPLAELTRLTSLSLWGTQVVDLTPLAELTALRSLFLSNTQVADLTPLSGLVALTSLYLTNTLVADLTPLLGIPGLIWLELMGTKVTQEAVDEMRNARPNCHIEF